MGHSLTFVTSVRDVQIITTRGASWAHRANKMDAVKNTLFPGAGGTNSESADGIPWWMKYMCKTAAILSGCASMFFGAWNIMTIFGDTLLCMGAGVWQIAAGFIIIVIEAPFCCMFLSFVAAFAEMAEARPPWQKAVLYIVFAIPPWFLCISLPTIIGSLAVGATGFLYGTQMVGKKASSADMAAAAKGNEPDERNIMDGGDDWGSHP